MTMTRAENCKGKHNMPDLTGYDRLAEFIRITDRMIGGASKDAIADAARILAIQVGHYERKFGPVAVDESVELLESETLSEEQASWVADGLEHLAVALATIK